MSLDESIVEDAALEWFGELGYAVGHGPHLAPGEPPAERDSFDEVVLVDRLRKTIRRLNPAVPDEAREEALRKVLRVGTPLLTQTNRAFHRMQRDGVPAEYPRPDGSIAGDHARLVDFGDVRANDWLAVNHEWFKVGGSLTARLHPHPAFGHPLPVGEGPGVRERSRRLVWNWRRSSAGCSSGSGS
jgi:type I restriction enzyme R subunit